MKQLTIKQYSEYIDHNKPVNKNRLYNKYYRIVGSYLEKDTLTKVNDIKYNMFYRIFKRYMK